MADIFDLTDEQIAAFAPVPQAEQPQQAPGFTLQIPMTDPGTSYFPQSMARVRGLGGGSYFGRQSSRSFDPFQQMGQRLEVAQKVAQMRAEQEAEFQAQQLGRQMMDLDPASTDYPVRRLQALQANPLALNSKSGKNLVDYYDTAYSQQEELRQQQQQEAQRQREEQFLSAVFTAPDVESLDALTQVNPVLSAKYNTILSNRMRRFSPDSTDPVREQNYWLNQQQQARRVLDDPIATKEAKALAEQRLALASQAFSQFAPQTAVGPSQMPTLAPAPQGSVNIKSVKPIQR